ncbi:unnamed protein product [Effrenium voratum]|uniref:Kinesin-like protein n=1 Tax=Effrenium voratum TaxID=2562239 RepID=A0AA36JPV4_9DINO|nr:unnamed protein product [Effrenium voratum]CAJ1420770.1 unnamed protein product [Effrenium voratum]
MVIEGALKEKLEALKFKPNSRRTGKPLVGTGTAASAASGASTAALAPPTPPSSTTSASRSAGLAVHVAVRCRPPRSGEVVQISAEDAGDKTALKLSTREGTSSVEGRTFRCNTYLSPEALQDDVAKLAAPLVQHTMEGGFGSILCHGITGSGKTYCMSGSMEGNNPSLGLVHGVGRRIFEHIRDQAATGKVFLVEASYAQIYSPDGTSEKIMDLLADAEDLEVKPDPRNPQSYVCAGLQRVPIRSLDDMQQLVSKGRQRCSAKEAAGVEASRSHCILTLSVESLLEQSSAPEVARGKLVLVDLAGSEAMLKAPSDVARRQALSINRTLASLSLAVNSSSPSQVKGSSLTQLLRDCMGGSARTLVIATIGPELDDLEETAKTLTYAQQMMTSLTARASGAGLHRIDQEQSALMQMKDRHNECIRMLREKVSDSREEEQEERRRLQQEMSEINNRLLTKDSAEKTLEELRQQQFSKMDEMRTEISQAMSEQMDQLRKQSQLELDQLKASVEKSQQEQERVKREAEVHEAAVAKLQVTLQDAQQAKAVAEQEAAALKVNLATAEERAKGLQCRQEELSKERAEFNEERKTLRQQGEQQWQRLAKVEADLSQFRSEAEAQRKEIERLNTAREEEGKTIRAEREAWRARERDMQAEVSDLQKKLDDIRKESEIQAFKVSKDHDDNVSKLKAQIEKLEVEAKAREDKLTEAQKNVANLEEERTMALHREEAIRQSSSAEIRKWQEELEQTKQSEQELMRMLEEVDGIIASGNQ